jgi:glycosyltransferase involved in cell wall biosynthesis
MKLTKQSNLSISNESTPVISIIVAVFNGAKTIQQCIDSVAQQSYPSKELVIIDGGSRDGTLELLEINNKKINYWISEPDRGIFNAWNKGLAQANGEWICFLGADDFLWDDQVLMLMSNELQKIPPDVHLAYAQIMLVNSDGESLFPAGKPWKEIKRRFMQGLCLPHQGVMHRRSLFEKHGNFDESFRIGGDYELMLRELKTNEALFVPGIIMTAMRQGGLSSNPANSVEAMKDVWRGQKMHGRYLPGFLWINAMLSIYIRLLLWNLVGEVFARKLLDFGRRVKGLAPYWTKT